MQGLRMGRPEQGAIQATVVVLHERMGWGSRVRLPPAQSSPGGGSPPSSWLPFPLHDADCSWQAQIAQDRSDDALPRFSLSCSFALGVFAASALCHLAVVFPNLSPCFVPFFREGKLSRIMFSAFTYFFGQQTCRFFLLLAFRADSTAAAAAVPTLSAHSFFVGKVLQFPVIFSLRHFRFCTRLARWGVSRGHNFLSPAKASGSVRGHRDLTMYAVPSWCCCGVGDARSRSS